MEEASHDEPEESGDQPKRHLHMPEWWRADKTDQPAADSLDTTAEFDIDITDVLRRYNEVNEPPNK